MSVYFGRETSCDRTLKSGRFVEGSMLVAQALFRRLITPRGTLRGGEEEANYGLDLASLVGSATTTAAVASLPGKIENELRKDPRVESVQATVTQTVEGPVTRWAVSVAVVTAQGPFVLQVGVSGVTAELLGITA